MKKSLNLLKQFDKVGITAALCMISSFSFAQETEIKNAQRLIDQDKKKQAIEVLRKATEAYPTAAQLYYHLGHTQLLAGDQAGAKSSFDKGASANPKEPLNFVGQGHILILEKKGAQAKPLFDKALGLGKKNVATLQAIAEAEMADRTMSKDALVQLQKAKGINGTDFKTAMLLGDYYLLENQGGSCASAYDDAETLNPSSGAPLYKHALLFMRTKNIPIVEEDLLKAIKIDPEFALAHKELGKLYYLKKDGPNAAKHQQIYLGLTDSPEKDDRFQYAFFLFMAKDYSKANDEFKLLSTKPDVTPMTLRFYAKSLTESGNLADAQKVFEQYMTTKKDSLKAIDYSNYADLLQKQKKDSLWANALETSVFMDKNQPKALESLVAYYFKVRKFAPCAAACATLIKIRKQPNANDYFTRGRAQIAIKQYAQADSSFAKLIELKPTFISAYLWAAKSKAAQDGKFDEKDSKVEWLAKSSYEKVVELGEADKDNNKKELVEAYQYLTSYYLFKQENQKAKEVLKKILEINPEDKDVIDAIKAIDQPVQQQKPKKR